MDFLEREPHHQGILLRDLLHPVLFKFIVQGNTEFKVPGRGGRERCLTDIPPETVEERGEGRQGEI